MESKKQKRLILLLGAFLMLPGCGNGNIVQENEILQRAVFSQIGENYQCELQSEQGTAAKGEGASLYECWNQAARQIQNPAAYGLMDTVFVEKEFSYAELTQIAALLQTEDLSFPKLEFYAWERKKQNIDISVKGLALTEILNSESAILLPEKDGENCWLMIPGQNTELSGSLAQAAMLLAGEKKKFSAAILCEGEEWQLDSNHVNWTVQTQPDDTATLFIDFHFAEGVNLQTGEKISKVVLPKLEKTLGEIFSQTLALTGTAPYGIPNLLAMQNPYFSNAAPLRVTIRISESI